MAVERSQQVGEQQSHTGQLKGVGIRALGVVGIAISGLTIWMSLGLRINVVVIQAGPTGATGSVIVGEHNRVESPQMPPSEVKAKADQQLKPSGHKKTIRALDQPPRDHRPSQTR